MSNIAKRRSRRSRQHLVLTGPSETCLFRRFDSAFLLGKLHRIGCTMSLEFSSERFMGYTSGRKSREKISALLLDDEKSGLANLLIV